MKKISGSVAVITGAGSGIGRALALEFASHGAALALADVNAAGLAETCKLAGKSTARSYVVDVAEEAAVEDFARNVARDFGRASLLVNNAGVGLRGTFAEISLDDIRWLMSINFWGVVHGCKFFLPLLEREAEAHIVNVSSLFGLIGPPGQTAYCASKFAVRGFTECLRLELRRTNVRVTCVHPGGIRTPIAENSRNGAKAPAISKAEIAERFAKLARTTPEAAARVIMQGILHDKPRVLIGSDARQIALLQRMMPVKATSLFASMVEKRMPAGAPEPATSER